MVWMVFFVAPFALKNGENISMTFILDKFIHTFAGRAVQNLINLIILLVVIFSFIESIKMAISGMDVISATIGIKMGYVYSPVVISLLILLSVAIENLFKSLCALFKYKES
jgi:TRAP-type C4-dicarboxylate transport system permease small subunit